MHCPWIRSTYVPLRERFREGREFTVNGERVTLIEADFDEDLALVRPHANPINLVLIEIEALEEQ